MNEEWLYRMALTMIPELGPVCTRALIDHFGEAAAVFKARAKDISAVSGIGEARARSIRQWNRFDEAEQELLFAAQKQIRLLFLTDTDYPRRLLHCFDPPSILYFLGNANLNHPRIISVVGTRNHSEYGSRITEEIVQALKAQSVLVVSGLAYGIDAVAHKACIQQGVGTVGVLAHGMDTIYPLRHKTLAAEMQANGGLLTEFPARTQPDRHNFPRRNRIVAGMADATIVVETAARGGSMITAELAHGYNRDVFAVPGRIGDAKSSGCLKLIAENKAILYTGMQSLLDTLGWQPHKPVVSRQQISLFAELTREESLIVSLLESCPMAIEELYIRSGLPASSVAASMLNLELEGIVISLPGKIYRLA